MTTKDPNAGLKATLVKKREMADAARMEGELNTLPQNQAEGLVLQMESTLEKMLPRTMDKGTAMSMVNNTIQLIRKTPRLAMCGNTLMGGVLSAAQLGLQLGVDALGEAYLLPFKKSKRIDGKWVDTWEAQLIIGYKGFRKLAWQSGTIKEISREIVYENDDFRVQYGTQRGLWHIPADGDRGPVKGYYATVVMANGGVMFTYMTLAEVEKHRDAYAMARKKDYQTKVETIVGPWKDNFNEMALKTVLLKTLRDCPLSIEDKLTAAFYLDGSTRENTREDYSDHRQILNASDMTTAFNATSVNVVEGETVPDPDEQQPAAQDYPDPALQDPQGQPVDVEAQPQVSDKDFIRDWCKANNEDEVTLVTSAIGVSHPTLEDYSASELREAADALQESIGQPTR